ncbi:hypothetical protein [Guptibacillus algicola]|uniref:hypothetical protein n=1 Tax=Guptibacillus algicola TaxID=225844 RepID=UPI001CD7DC41|nr:hypothetical protein [Alkalihalobacillus algicola]MCA0987349.1 hypothetical protein [Alkalihalobacillus algicola]
MVKTNLRRILFPLGVWITAIGIAFNESFIKEIPDYLSVLSIPLLISGLVLIVASNFFRKKQT